MRGYSADGSQPSQPRVPSAHEDGSRPSWPIRRGMRPMIVQPMRPVASATTRFWCGMPTSGASACASSRPPADSMRNSAAFSPPSRSATQASARFWPRWSVSTIGPQIVDGTSSVSSFPPFDADRLRRALEARGPSGVR